MTWVENWLCGRKVEIMVFLQGMISGVPQGPVLRLQLFTAFINNLAEGKEITFLIRLSMTQREVTP